MNFGAFQNRPDEPFPYATTSLIGFLWGADFRVNE